MSKGGAAAAPPMPTATVPLQVPLASLADVRVVEGPSMIKSENGRLRAYVQLTVRNRDEIGFVEEASLLIRRKRPNQAKLRSATQRRGRSLKPLTSSLRLTISRTQPHSS